LFVCDPRSVAHYVSVQLYDRRHTAPQDARDIEDLEAAHTSYLQQAQRAALGVSATPGLPSAAFRVADAGCMLAQHGGLHRGLADDDVWSDIEAQLNVRV